MIRIFDHSDFDGPMANWLITVVSLEIFPHQPFLGRKCFRNAKTQKKRLQVDGVHFGLLYDATIPQKMGYGTSKLSKKKCQLAHQHFWHQTVFFVFQSFGATIFKESSAKSLAMSFRSSWVPNLRLQADEGIHPENGHVPQKKGPCRKKISSSNHWCLVDLLVFGGV